METIEKTTEVLNDLIEINNDRIAGFEHAIKGLEESDFGLKTIFENFTHESSEYVSQLRNAISQVGGEIDNGHSASGAIHRTWLDVKATFSGHDRKSVLEECERGEDAIKKAYKEALAPDSGLSTEFTSLISQQQVGITAAHDKIKALRDSQA